jgi:hypothetical protein
MTKRRQQNLIDLLEQADEQATFPLMELPPELRVRIYTLYFTSFPANGRSVLSVPPPLYETSRQIREESRLLFYQTRRFLIDLGFPGGAKAANAKLVREFFRKAPLESIRSIRRLYFDHIQVVCPTVPKSLIIATIEVDLPMGKHPVRVKVLESWRTSLSAPEREVAKQYAEKLEK